MKKVLTLDFDGVLHSNDLPFQGTVATIPGKPVDGAIDFITRASEVFDLNIFSVRNESPAGISAMRSWLQKNGLAASVLNKIKFPTTKPISAVFIDDRALTFDGTFPALAELEAFQPWNKKKANK